MKQSDENLCRLPQWAQRRLTYAERRIEELNAIIQDFSEDSGTGVTYRPTHKLESSNLPDCDVTWRLSNGSISVRRDREGGFLHIIGMGDCITVAPCAANAVNIKVVR